MKIVVYDDERYPVYIHRVGEPEFKFEKVVDISESDYEDLLRVGMEYEAWQDKLKKLTES